MAQAGCEVTMMGSEPTPRVAKDHSKRCARIMDKRKKVTGANELLAKQPAPTPRGSAEGGARAGRLGQRRTKAKAR